MRADVFFEGMPARLLHRSPNMTLTADADAVPYMPSFLVNGPFSVPVKLH